MLSELSKLKLNLIFGLYRDDCLGISSSTPRQIEIIKKKICQVFQENGLDVTVDANKKVVTFLDIELDLENGTHRPYIKPNDAPLYVHRQSNHPLCVTKNIPESVNRRLSSLSSNKEMFNSVAPVYQEALDKSGYDLKLEFTPIDETPPRSNRNRKRQMLYFNPPFSADVKTNIGKRFLMLVDRHFGQDNPLRKIFNRNTLKVSYRCTPNLAKAICGHNAKILKESGNPVEERACSCRNGTNCPLGGQCLQKNLVYQATVIQDGTPDQTYIGLSAPPFKDRLGNHKKSFNNDAYKKETTLSKYVWSLKRKNEQYDIKWRLLTTAKPFNPVTEICNLCTAEKFHLVFKSELATLNKRDEIKNHCRHKIGQLLDKT